MEHDRTILNEIAMNRRVVQHPIYGSFIIKRPTNKIQSLIDTVRTKSLNKDLQTKMMITDPETGKEKPVPAFFTKKMKHKVLVECGEWTEEDEKELEQADADYRQICRDLNDLGYISVARTLEAYKEIFERVTAIAENKGKNVDAQMEVLFPILDTLKSGDLEEIPILPEASDEKEFAAAGQKLEKTLKDLEVVNLLSTLTDVHKQYVLIMRGLQAQSRMFVIKLKEISLFADTIEARADGAGRVAKVFYCTFREDESKAWKTLEECEDRDQELLNWLYGQIEKFERLDPMETEETQADRFNFLFPQGLTKGHLGDLQDQPLSNSDGEPQEATPSISLSV
jgi:hypothetical protein